MKKKKLNYNDIVLRKWPSVFRDGIKIVDHDLGILEVSTHGEAEITAKDLEQMKKLAYIHVRTNVYLLIPDSEQGHVDIQDEDDLSDYLVTSITFREYQAPPLENGGKSDRQVFKRMKPQQTEIGVPAP